MRFLLLFTMIIVAAPALAWAANIYEIKDVSVSLKVNNQAEVRNQAIIEAEKKAFDELQKRLLATGYIEGKQQVPQTRIINAVDSIDIQNEKISDKIYKASYNITFSDAEVSDIFTVGYIAQTKDLEKFVVVPMVAQGDNVKIWKNTWWKDWTEQKHDNIILPLGDLQDVQNLKPEDIAGTADNGISRIKKRYGVNNIVLVRGEFAPLENVLLVKLTRIKDKDRIIITYEYPGDENITEKDLFAAAANDIIYRLENEKLTDESLVTSATEIDIEPVLLKPKGTGNLPPTPPVPNKASAAAPVPLAAAPAAEMPADKLDNPDQPLNSLEEIGDETTPAEDYEAAADQIKHYDIIVIADDLIAWNRIRNKLIQTDGLSNLQIKSFTAGHASISLGYKGEISSLAPNFAAQGLELSGDAGNWILKEKP